MYQDEQPSTAEEEIELLEVLFDYPANYRDEWDWVEQTNPADDGKTNATYVAEDLQFRWWDFMSQWFQSPKMSCNFKEDDSKPAPALLEVTFTGGAKDGLSKKDFHKACRDLAATLKEDHSKAVECLQNGIALCFRIPSQQHDFFILNVFYHNEPTDLPRDQGYIMVDIFPPRQLQASGKGKGKGKEKEKDKGEGRKEGGNSHRAGGSGKASRS